MVEINWLAVALATVLSMIVGSIWYAPPVFGAIWMRLANLKKEDMERVGWKPIPVSILTSAIMAFVLAHFTYMASSFYENDYNFLTAAVVTAFWAWLGFIGLRFLTHDAYEGRPTSLTILNSAHELVTILAMAAVIGFMGV